MGWFRFSKKNSRLPNRFKRPRNNREVTRKVIRQEQNLKSTEFKKLIRNQLSPNLRQMGFVGSGFTYRRVTDKHYVHAIQIFPNPRGGECWMEAGVDIDVLPNSLDERIEPKKITVLDCEIRKHLVLPDGYEKYDYGITEEDGIETIQLMMDVIRKHGMQYFENFQNFPQPLVSIQPEDFLGQSNKLDELGANSFPVILFLARLHLWLGEQNRATAFADYGLSRIEGERGSGLIPMFEKVKNGNLI